MTRDEAEKAVVGKLGFTITEDGIINPLQAHLRKAIAALWNLAVSQQLRIGELEEVWIPVEERFPELKEIYKGGPKNWRGLIFNGHYVDKGCLEETLVKRKLTWKDSRDRCAYVTHWRPLPAPPEVKP